MLLGLSWPWWVLTVVAAYGVVRLASLMAAVASEVRGECSPPFIPGWFRPEVVALPAGWVMFGGLAIGAASFTVVAAFVYPNDPDLRRMFGGAAAIVGFLIGAIGEAQLALWAQRSLVPRLLAADLPGHLESLQLGDEVERLRAARCLVRMGRYAEPAVELLTAAVRRDESPEVRLVAWEALSDLSLASVPIPADLSLASLDDPDPRVRAIAACHAVRRATRDGTNLAGSAPSPGQVAALAAGVMLSDSAAGPQGEPLAETSARALAALGPLAGPAVPALRDAVFDRLPPNVTAIDALTRIGPAAVPTLVEMLIHPVPAIRREAADMLGWMGKDANDAIPALRAMRAAYPEDADRAEFAIEMIEHA